MRRLSLAVLVALLAVPASAHAAFFPAEVIDGPSPDLMRVGDLDVARDGQGGVVYTKQDGGVPHVFFSHFVDGAFQQGVRVDQGLAGASSDPVIGASDNGRLAIAYVNDGSLFTTVLAKGAQGLAAPTLVAQGGVSRPSIDVSINGATYVSWTQGGDVHVARAERDSPQFTVLPTAVDVNPNTNAGDTDRKRSKIDVSADGTALVVWGEDAADGHTHVYARRIFEQRLSTAPQDLNVPEVAGAAATDADTADLDMEDDSSYAQVVFRQNTTAGPHLLMRRLVGSQFDPAVVIDSGIPGDSASIDLNGKGEGLFATSGAGGEVVGGTLFNNKVAGAARLNDPNGVTPAASSALGENEDGAVAWFQGTADNSVVRARYFVGTQYLKLTDDGTLTRPEFGGAYPAGGLKAESSRAGDVAVVFMQGGPTDRRLVAGFYDRPPTRIAGVNTQKLHKLTRLAWGSSLNLFGGTKYTIVLDGKPLATTGDAQFLLQPGQVPDGKHTWQIQIADRRGQTVVSRTRQLKVDNTPPTLRIGLSKRGRTLTVTAKAGDPNGALPSGLRRILVDFGNGKLLPMKRKMGKTYAKTGRYTVRVKAVDKAGNETVQQRTVSIGK